MSERSNLEEMIERFVTQKACLDKAIALIRDVPGPALELGLGKGRTFDHLRTHGGGREIFVFDRGVYAVPSLRPDHDHFIEGDFLKTLPHAHERIGEPAALVHADMGSDDPVRDAELAAELAPLIDALARAGAVVLSDREMEAPRWTPLPLPDDAGDWPYFMWRVEG